ncbi:MAG TPA: hypothetical protein VGA08_02015 [Candidatus Saccharimonadales bacterium]
MFFDDKPILLLMKREVDFLATPKLVESDPEMIGLFCQEVGKFLPAEALPPGATEIRLTYVLSPTESVCIFRDREYEALSRRYREFLSLSHVLSIEFESQSLDGIWVDGHMQERHYFIDIKSGEAYFRVSKEVAEHVWPEVDGAQAGYDEDELSKETDDEAEGEDSEPDYEEVPTTLQKMNSDQLLEAMWLLGRLDNVIVEHPSGSV